MGFMDDAEVQTRKFTRLEYDRLIEAEFFGPDDRIELVGGHMVVKEPLALDDESEPEPDISVVPADPDDYEGGYPTSAALVVEVALSRLRFDRRHKSSLYARARIADYWIVNLPDDRLEVFRDPMPDSAATFGWRYGLNVVLGREQRVTPLALPAASIAVADLLSRIRRG
jgi:Uma2 family endonuclease